MSMYATFTVVRMELMEAGHQENLQKLYGATEQMYEYEKQTIQLAEMLYLANNSYLLFIAFPDMDTETKAQFFNNYIAPLDFKISVIKRIHLKEQHKRYSLDEFLEDFKNDKLRERIANWEKVLIKLIEYERDLFEETEEIKGKLLEHGEVLASLKITIFYLMQVATLILLYANLIDDKKCRL